MSFPILVLIIATLGLLWFLLNQRKIKRLNGLKELPGPLGLPLIGSLLALAKGPNKQFCKWADKYGDMYQVKLGNQRIIVISHPKLCKEIFSNDPALTGRPQFVDFMIYDRQPGLGIFTSEGERWEVHRRFLIRQLRDFGFGKSSMEALIMYEVKEVLATFQKNAGRPISGIRDTVTLAVVNSLWMLMSSQRYDHDDPKLLQFCNDTIRALDDLYKKGALVVFAPWIKNIFPEFSGYLAVRKVFDDNRVMFEKTVQEHKKVFKEEQLKDFIDVYLAEMRKAEADTSSLFYGETAERQLVVTLFDMFIAGTDSTAITISWSLVFLCKFREVQRKLQEEISEITGSCGREVSLSDRPNMPYTMATIDEILRYSSIASDGVQHRALSDTQFHGYHIPKGSLIQPNLYYIHHNPKIWGDSENFRPERFLSPDGKKYMKSENLMPFQIGRRQCVGESLARDTIFLYLTNMFQKFDMGFNPNEPEPGLDCEVGFFRTPLPHSIIMTQRLCK